MPSDIERTSILDHGYVALVEKWGSDESIVEAARMSTDKGFLGWGPKHCDCTPEPNVLGLAGCQKCQGKGQVAGDEKLLRYLYEHQHHTPFEMAGMMIEVQAPIFVFREWQRHRTQSYNELSARYTTLPDLFYLPSIERIMAGKQSLTSKQGSQAGFTMEQAKELRTDLRCVYADSRAVYEALLEAGVTRELARLVIPVAQYSRMRASANLRNWLAFLTLRAAPNAQWEIQQYAFQVARLVALNFPRVYALFVEAK